MYDLRGLLRIKSIYILIFFFVSVPLILNIRINELSNKIDHLNSEIYLLERSKNTIDIIHHESYSISSLEKLAKIHSYERLEISQKINQKYKKLDLILNTHHHFDHVGGNVELKKKYGSKILGFEKDKDRIPKIDILLKDEQEFKIGNLNFKTLFIPGHTSGHIAFYLEKEKVVFTGDPYQIDNPYVDAESNGLTWLVEKLKGQPLVGHMTVTKGERSELAELAANIF